MHEIRSPAASSARWDKLDVTSRLRTTQYHLVYKQGMDRWDFTSRKGWRELMLRCGWLRSGRWFAWTQTRPDYARHEQDQQLSVARQFFLEGCSWEVKEELWIGYKVDRWKVLKSTTSGSGITLSWNMINADKQSWWCWKVSLFISIDMTIQLDMRFGRFQVLIYLRNHMSKFPHPNKIPISWKPGELGHQIDK